MSIAVPAPDLQIENARLHERIAQLEQQESNRYRAIVEDQTELICRYLADGRLTFVNEAYCRYFGKQHDDLIGNSFVPLVPDEDVIVVKEAIASLAPDNPVITMTHRVILENGDTRWQRWVDRAFYNDDGVFVEAQAVGRDITEEYLLREQIEAQRSKAQEQLALVRRHLANSAEIERLKIAHELHDGPLQTLLSLTFLIDALRDDMPTEATADQLDAMRQHILNVCQSLRHTLTMLRPPGLIEMGLHSALSGLLQEIHKKQPLLTIHEQLARNRSSLSAEVALCFYRIASEAITNVIKHANADNLYVMLIDDDDMTRLEIRDDGSGYDATISAEELTRTRHFGIAGMHERAAWIGASLTIATLPNNGTTVTLLRRRTDEG